MEQGTFDFADEAMPAPVKLCECGCGQPAPIAKWNDKRKGAVKGQPQRYIHGHRRHERRLFVEVGQRIGRGVVIDAEVQIPPSAAEKKPARGARLLCDCGEEYVVRLHNLLSKKPTLSCGCLNREAVRLGRAQSDLVIRLPEGRAARNCVLSNYRLGARKRGLCWELTDEDFDRLTAQDCYYCGSPPGSVRKAVEKKVRRYNGDFTYNGIDRIDNTVGYTPENVVTCCGTCNFAKKEMTLDQFMTWVARLVEHAWFHPEILPSRLLGEVKD